MQAVFQFQNEGHREECRELHAHSQDRINGCKCIRNTFRKTSPNATTNGVGQTAMHVMSPAAKAGLAASEHATPSLFKTRPVAASWSVAMTKADAELMEAKIAMRDAESPAAEATT